MTTTTLSKEKLFAYLVVDDIEVEEEELKKAQDGDGSSLSKIADIYYENKNYAKAMEWFRLGAAKDNAYSQFKLGRIHAEGNGVAVDYKLAMEWYLKVHNNGHIMAAQHIGFSYSNGFGVAQDYNLALKWFFMAANKGYELAQFNLGVLYERGNGVKIDKQYALEWYEKSAEQGYEGAKTSVKRLNEQGFYIDDRQKKYIRMEKDLDEQKSKLESLENQLKTSEQKRTESDKENKILKQENKILKLKYYINTKNQRNINEDIMQQLGGIFSKMMTDLIRSNATNDSKADEESPENDICFNL